MRTRGKTCIATPPGATILDLLCELGMTPKDLALKMNQSEEVVNKLLIGKTPITEEIAQQLESVLGAPAQFWNALELNFRNKLSQIKSEGS